MSQLKRNLAANFIGNLWTPLLWVAVVPLYLSALGVEAFGLMGLYIALQAILVQLDLGLSGTLNRELARLSTLEGTSQEMRNLLRTMEVIYWCVGLGIALLVIGGAGLIADHWVKPEALSRASVRQGIMTIGLALACQWPLALYAGGLTGLQRQVSLNVVNVIMNALKFLGVLPLLWLVSATVQTFFLWQAAIGFLHVAVLGICLWQSLPKSPVRPRLGLNAMKPVWRFAAATWFITLLWLVMMQLDKVVLSKLTALEVFGYYTLAAVAASGLSRIFGSVHAAVYPRLTQLAALRDESALALLYHRASQLTAVLTFAVAGVVAFFPREVLLAWTGNPAAADRTSWVLSLLVIGTTLNGLGFLPTALQWAHGWTRLALVSSIVSILVIVPVMFFLTLRYASQGAAATWVLLNAGWLLATVPLMHRRLLRGELWKWCVQDNALPLAAALAVVVPGRFLIPPGLSRWGMSGVLAGLAVAAFLAATLAAPEARREILARIGRQR